MDRTQVLEALSALANDTRLDIVRLLVRAGPDGRPAGEIARQVQASSSRLSFHLGVLEQARLVSAQRQGRRILYRLDRPAMGNLMGFLLSDCCADCPEIRSTCEEHGAI